MINKFFLNRKIITEVYFQNLKGEFPLPFYPFVKFYLFFLGPPLPFKHLRTAKILKMSDRVNFKSFLDLGCGVGDIAMLLALRFNNAKVEAVDIDKKKIKLAEKVGQKNKIRANFKTANLEKLFLIKKKYGGIICSNIAAHLKNDWRLMGNFRNMLKDKGYLIFCEDVDTRRIISKEKEKEVGHFRNGYNFRKLVLSLKKEGFDILEYHFLDTRDICNKYFYKFNGFSRLIFFPLFMFFLKISEIKKGNRPNMVVILAKLKS